MRRLGIVAVGLALVVGIVVGGMVGNPFGRSAPASAAGQAREDQITIFGQSWSGARVDMPAPWGLLNNSGLILFAVDPSDYPPSSTFRLEGVWHQESRNGQNGTGCLRLFDQTEGSPVSTSEACSSPIMAGDLLIRSSPFSLAAGEHEYTVQGQCTPDCLALVWSARLIIDWTEPYAVGGFAELPPLASVPGGSGMGGGTYAVLAGAAAGVLAFAVLATLTVKKRRLR